MRKLMYGIILAFALLFASASPASAQEVLPDAIRAEQIKAGRVADQLCHSAEKLFKDYQGRLREIDEKTLLEVGAMIKNTSK